MHVVSMYAGVIVTLHLVVYVLPVIYVPYQSQTTTLSSQIALRILVVCQRQARSAVAAESSSSPVDQA